MLAGGSSFFADKRRTLIGNFFFAISFFPFPGL